MTDVERQIRSHAAAAAAERPKNADGKALLAQALLVSEEWDRWMLADDPDAEFPFFEWSLTALRSVLDGSRRMRLNKDQYGFWRSRCECGWSGSPQGGGVEGDVRTGREQAIDEYAAHDCFESEG